MELEKSIETIAEKVKSIDVVEGQIAELKDALEAVKSAQTEVVVEKSDAVEVATKSFWEAARTGENTPMELVKGGVMNVADATSAGAGVLTEVSRNIIESLLEEHVLASRFARKSVGSKKYEKRVMKSGATMRWEGENVSLAQGAHTGSPEFETISAKFGKAVAKPVITAEALVDPFFNAEAVLLADTRRQLSRGICEALLVGAGEHQPVGFLTKFKAAPTKADEYKLIDKAYGTDDELIALLEDLPFEIVSGYVPGSEYIVSREVARQIRGLKDANGQPLMQPSMAQGVYGTFGGHNIVVDPMLNGRKVQIIFGRVSEAFEVLSVPTAMDFIRNPYKIDFAVEYTIGNYVGTIGADAQAIVGVAAPVSKKK